MLAISILGGIFYVVISQNQRYQEHFQSIIFGRAERSSGGRFALWERGVDVLVDRQIGLWGIGPENFRVVDWQGKQLHNDLLAFVVERGLLGAFGLIGLAVIAITKTLNLLLKNYKSPERAQLVDVIFLAAVVATLVESLTHQIFHDRQLWLVLAVLEAVVYTRMVSESRLESTSNALSEQQLRPQGLVLHNNGSDS
jgi:O-antigen ligase